MGLGLRELIIIFLVIGIVFLPYFRKIAAKNKPPLRKKQEKEDRKIIDAEWEELE